MLEQIRADWLANGWDLATLDRFRMEEPDPPKPPPPPAPTPPAPPAPGGPDLTGLQTALDAAKTEGEKAAQAEMLKALGFDKRADAEAWIKAKRDEETSRLSDDQKREAALIERETKAAAAEAAAARATMNARITAGLVTAGAPPANVADLVDLVKVAADADDAAITAAIEAKKTQFPALFIATPAPPTPPAPPGLPGKPPPPGTPPGDPLAAGKQRAAAIKAGRTGATRDDLIAQFSPRPSPLVPTT